MRRQPPDVEEPHDYEPRPLVSERIIERVNGNGFGRLKDAVFTAVLLAAGWVIWNQQSQINEVQKDVVALKLKCPEQPLMRGGSQ